jgi:chemotaxis response regulator CheB
MADKDAKITLDQRLNKKDKLKKKPSRRHTEQRQAEQEQNKGFADHVPQEDTGTVPKPPGIVHENKSATPDTAGETRKEGAFPVVCIGASAGGLQALESFFAELPAESGMAFVVITHTDPEHVSMLPEIIRKKSRVAVS